MNEKVYVATERTPMDLKGKIANEPIDEFELLSFLQSELLGRTSHIIKYYDELIKKEERHYVDRSKMTFFERVSYDRKKEKRIKQLTSKKEEMKQNLEFIKERARKVTNICAKYGLNLDGSFMKNSKYNEIYQRMHKACDLKIRDEFSKEMLKVKNELASAYAELKSGIPRLEPYIAFIPNYIGDYYRVSYDKLSVTHGEEKSLLNPILNRQVREKMDLDKTYVYDYNDKIDFTEEAIKKSSHLSIEFGEFKILRDSKALNEKELALLDRVEIAYKNVAISLNKRDYYNTIIKLLGDDERFLKVKESLNKELEKELKNSADLITNAKELYNKYGVKEQIELIESIQEKKKEQGELLSDIDREKEDNNYQRANNHEQALQESAKEEKEIKGRTLMAQYLREKAFKTEDSKLSFKEYAKKYAYLYDLDEKMVDTLNDDLVNSNGKTL